MCTCVYYSSDFCIPFWGSCWPGLKAAGRWAEKILIVLSTATRSGPIHSSCNNSLGSIFEVPVLFSRNRRKWGFRNSVRYQLWEGKKRCPVGMTLLVVPAMQDPGGSSFIASCGHTKTATILYSLRVT